MRFNLDLLIMPRSDEASSTKSSTLSGKASSVKKAVKKGVKAATVQKTQTGPFCYFDITLDSFSLVYSPL